MPRAAGAASYQSRPAQEAAHQRALFGDPLRQAVEEVLRNAGAQKGMQVVPDVRLDEATLDIVGGKSGMHIAKIGKPVTLARGTYKIVMVGQASDDNVLTLVVR